MAEVANLVMAPATRRPAAPARPDRKRDILLAAERLFAQRGYHAVSIRQIADEAGVPLALVGYHWGAKHELFGAIFELWRPTIVERVARLQALGEAPPASAPRPRGVRGVHETPAGDPVRNIMRAFVEPVLALRASAEGEWYARLVARELYHLNPETDRILRRHFDPLAHAFIDALRAALPHATRGAVAWCYQFALGALQLHISDDRVERLSRGENRAADPAAAEALIDFVTGGIHAALPAPPRTSKRRQAA